MISRLKLMDFRCYGSFSWQIPQQGAIILGNNAQGKTSLLEAVCFLLRLQSPEMSLSQLAEKCDPPVTKSCMNHRMRKLLEEAKKL